MVALDCAVPSPSFHTIGKASSAVFACHQVSATTATALSFTFTTRLKPGRCAILDSSKLFDPAAEHRAIPDRRAHHSRQLHVDRIDLAAVELVGGVEPL